MVYILSYLHILLAHLRDVRFETTRKVYTSSPFWRTSNEDTGNQINTGDSEIFAKAAQIVLEARAYPETISPSLYPTKEESNKLNKWFNLYMNSIPDITKDDLRLWKTPELASLPPMIIETYIDLRQLPPNQILVLFDDIKHPWPLLKVGVRNWKLF